MVETDKRAKRLNGRKLEEKTTGDDDREIMTSLRWEPLEVRYVALANYKSRKVSREKTVIAIQHTVQGDSRLKPETRASVNTHAINPSLPFIDSFINISL